MPPMLGKRSKAERDYSYDAERRRVKPWRALYSTARWRRRRLAQLRRQPLCERHLALGQVVAATVANHKVPHRGDETLFFEGELESVCKTCHDSVIQIEERIGR